MSKRKRPAGASVMDLFTSARHAQSSTQPESLISFYEETGADNRGRHLSDVLRWEANKMESSHDYIQTLFPLPERSGVNDRAPIIDRKVFEAFREREDLRDKLREAFQKMLWFYGFELGTNKEDGKLIVKKGHNFADHSQNWLTRFDHNHLRITRIIRSLRVLGLEDEALAFYDVISTATIVSSRSRMYWGRAAYRPLNIRPDVDEEGINEEKMGPKFLRECEQAKREKAHQETEARDEETGATITKAEQNTKNGSTGESEQLEDEAPKKDNAEARG